MTLQTKAIPGTARTVAVKTSVYWSVLPWALRFRIIGPCLLVFSNIFPTSIAGKDVQDLGPVCSGYNVIAMLPRLPLSYHSYRRPPVLLVIVAAGTPYGYRQRLAVPATLVFIITLHAIRQCTP